MDFTADGDINISSSEIIGRDKNVYITYGPTEREQLAAFLKLASQGYAGYVRSLLSSTPPPSSPYLFLQPYEIQHRSIFFGRQAVVQQLMERVLSERLTLLHARSGAGKSSVLNAGLGPCLLARNDILPIFARTYNDPVGAVIEQVASKANEPVYPSLLSKVPLREVLSLLASRPYRPAGEQIVIVFDQFEELINLTAPRLQYAFFNQIVECIEDMSLPLHFVLALRAEYLSDLDKFSKRLPRILNNTFLLEPMNDTEIREAITGPVKVLDSQTSYAPDLLEKLLQTLKGAAMDLPTLQIICYQLYEVAKAAGNSFQNGLQNGRQIDMALYRQQGEYEGIVTNYVEHALESRPDNERALAKSILKTLVDFGGIRLRLTLAEIQERIQAQANPASATGDLGAFTLGEKELAGLLSFLIERRLVRLTSRTNKTSTYELVHDKLAEHVLKWFDQQALPRRQRRELVERGLSGYTFNILLDDTALEFIAQQQAEIDWTEKEAIFIAHSAAASGIGFAYWIPLLVKLRRVDILALALKSSSGHNREAITKALAQLGEPGLRALFEAYDKYLFVSRYETTINLLVNLSDPTLESLLNEYQTHASPNIRSAAMLIRARRSHSPEAIDPFLFDPDKGVRRLAAEELSGTRTSEAFQKLLATLDDPDPENRQVIMANLTSNLYMFSDDERKLFASSAWEASQDGSRAPNTRSLAACLAGYYGDPRVIPILTGLMNSPDAPLRIQAARTLAELAGPETKDILVTALNDRLAEVRAMAAAGLGRLPAGQPRVKEALLEATQDPVESVQASAATALAGYLGNDEPVFERLLCLLESPAREVRSAVLDGFTNRYRYLQPLSPAHLQRLVEPLLNSLEESDEFITSKVAKLLSYTGDPRAVEPIFKAFSRTKDSSYRVDIMEALSEFGDPRAEEALLDRLVSEESFIRTRAIMVLTGLKSQKGFAKMQELVTDPSQPYREEYLSAFSSLEGEARPLETVTAACADQDPQVRKAALAVLAAWKEPRALEVVLPCLEDPVPEVSSQAVIALAATGDPRALPYLVKAYQQPELRGPVIRNLTSFKGPEVTSLYVDAISTEDASLREIAALNLSQMDPAPFRALWLHAAKDNSQNVRMHAAYALFRLAAPPPPPLQPLSGEPAPAAREADSSSSIPPEASSELEEALLALLEDEYTPTIVIAARGLSEMNSQAAREPLLKLLDSENSDRALAAVEALANFNEGRVVPVLFHIKKTSEYWDIQRYVSPLEPGVLLPELMRLLSDPDPLVAAKAAEYLENNSLADPVLPLLNEMVGKLAPGTQAIIIRLLNAKDPAGIRVLVDLISSEDEAVRWAVAEKLAKSGEYDKMAAENIKALLRPILAAALPGSGAETPCAWALGMLGEQDVLDRMRKLLDAPDLAAKLHALKALPQLRINPALVLPYADHEDPRLRLAALQGLWLWSNTDPKARQVIQRAAQDRNLEIRREIFGDFRYGAQVVEIPILITGLVDEDLRVVSSAAGGLLRLEIKSWFGSQGPFEQMEELWNEQRVDDLAGLRPVLEVLDSYAVDLTEKEQIASRLKATWSRNLPESEDLIAFLQNEPDEAQQLFKLAQVQAELTDNNLFRKMMVAASRTGPVRVQGMAVTGLGLLVETDVDFLIKIATSDPEESLRKKAYLAWGMSVARLIKTLQFRDGPESSIARQILDGFLTKFHEHQSEFSQMAAGVPIDVFISGLIPEGKSTPPAERKEAESGEKPGLLDDLGQKIKGWFDKSKK